MKNGSTERLHCGLLKLEHLTPEQGHPYPAFCSPTLLNYGAKVGDILIEKVLKQLI